MLHALRLQSSCDAQGSTGRVRLEGAALRHGAERCCAHILVLGRNGCECVLVSRDVEVRRLGDCGYDCRSVDLEVGVRSRCRSGQRPKGKEGGLIAMA